jgi:hypothetical protein
MMSTSWPSWLPGQDRAAVEEDRRQVEAGGGHQHAGQRLVAAGEQHRAVEPLGVHHGLDRVGDDLAAHQRGPHALVAHRDAVGHRDGAELEREAAGVAHAVLGRLASRSSDRLHGVTSFQLDDATPICGLSQSSSVMPTARAASPAAAPLEAVGDVAASDCSAPWRGRHCAAAYLTGCGCGA